MSAFTLDTSGVVVGRSAAGVRIAKRWTDLTPFTQGALTAALEELNANLRAHYGDGFTGEVGFRRLAPETLARFIEDGERFVKSRNAIAKPGENYGSSAWGRWLWEQRQTGRVEDFPPLTLDLADDGLIRIREGVA